MPLSTPANRKKTLVRAAVVLAVLAVLGALSLRGVDFRGLFERALDGIRSAGPWAFFAAMALLPALGVPAMTFTLTAGPAFAGTMGTAPVVAAALAAMTANLLLTYWLARRALRPSMARLLQKLGYRIPDLDSGDLTDLIVVLRVTPGVPFFVQNYLLGLAGAPLGRYLAISCAIVWSYTAALVVFGDAFLHGRAGLAFSAVLMLVALMAVLHFVRRHYAGAKKAP